MSSLVNTLGMVAGSVWVGAAIWFELIHPKRVHAKYVIGTFLIGSALILASSSTVLASPTLAESFAVAANILFTLLGCATWVYIEKHTDDPPTADDLSESTSH
ncbi:hypothetical protein SAMN05192561_11221 [Halopenitus malekzadehii]|uniref:SPW repeat-containing protein n=1 Tax=Halopenitus malekzadehii TaxID=1267564 RepID=A0A1H6JJF4_9EURY|nr:hypothetical protein [Halopenitus malekzadehii]SEH60623.1 hypothetical protein SAMN05192561_11221 [Halopenitus malekzadehii]